MVAALVISRGIAQLVARCVRDAEAESSSLSTPTKTTSLWTGGFFVVISGFFRYIPLFHIFAIVYVEFLKIHKFSKSS